MRPRRAGGRARQRRLRAATPRPSAGCAGGACGSRCATRRSLPCAPRASGPRPPASAARASGRGCVHRSVGARNAGTSQFLESLGSLFDQAHDRLLARLATRQSSSPIAATAGEQRHQAADAAGEQPVAPAPRRHDLRDSDSIETGPEHRPVGRLAQRAGIVERRRELARDEARRQAQRRSTTRNAIPSSSSRLGATGCGDTRGGSITRNCAPPVSCTPMPMIADSRRDKQRLRRSSSARRSRGSAARTRPRPPAPSSRAT